MIVKDLIEQLQDMAPGMDVTFRLVDCYEGKEDEYISIDQLGLTHCDGIMNVYLEHGTKS